MTGRPQRRKQTDDEIRRWNLAAAARRHRETHTPAGVHLESGSAWMAGTPILTAEERAADYAILAREREQNRKREARRASRG